MFRIVFLSTLAMVLVFFARPSQRKFIKQRETMVVEGASTTPALGEWKPSISLPAKRPEAEIRKEATFATATPPSQAWPGWRCTDIKENGRSLWVKENEEGVGGEIWEGSCANWEERGPDDDFIF